VGAALVAALAFAGTATSRHRAVVVGSKNFTEQVLLGEIVAALLESRGYAVDRRLNLGGTNVCHEAVLSGQLDVYVEYTGTALTDILKRPVRSDPAEVLREVQSAYAPLGLRVGQPLGFNNTFALVMRRADAARLRIARISDLASHAATLRVGLFGEFLERKDGMAGLLATYGFRFGVRPREMDLGLLYPALAAGQVDLVVGSATDGLIAALDMVVLQDDRHYFPPYDAVPILNEATLARHPELVAALDALAGRIDEATMRRLNYAVDGEHRAPAAVARELLAGIGLYRDKSATTLTGPPDPPAIFMGRASTQAPASGRELMSPRFSSPGTFARAAIWWTAKSFEGPWSMLAVSTPNAATWRSSTRRRAASAPYDGKCRREASPGVSSPK
jgi:glycine betaine/choline ABC-type transport system substrate-binding protein